MFFLLLFIHLLRALWVSLLCNVQWWGGELALWWPSNVNTNSILEVIFRSIVVLCKQQTAKIHIQLFRINADRLIIGKFFVRFFFFSFCFYIVTSLGWLSCVRRPKPWHWIRMDIGQVSDLRSFAIAAVVVATIEQRSNHCIDEHGLRKEHNTKIKYPQRNKKQYCSMLMEWRPSHYYRTLRYRFRRSTYPLGLSMYIHLLRQSIGAKITSPQRRVPLSFFLLLLNLNFNVGCYCRSL